MGKPFTAVTVLVERLTEEQYAENDFGGIPELIEAIKLQDSGPTEACRALRKKLKYGSVHRQLRALTILDALVDNAGKSFQRIFGSDEPLQERLRIAATDTTTDSEVKEKLRVLFKKWAVEYKDAPGLRNVATLYKQFPQRKTRPPAPTLAQSPGSPTPASPVSSPTTATSHATASAQSPRQTTSAVAPPRPAASSSFGFVADYDRHSKKDKKKDRKHSVTTFNLEKEKPALKEALANASVASTNLTNALKRVNREKETSSQNAEAAAGVGSCKSLRKTILRYIQHVESDEWLGSLIHANEELVAAIQLFEEYNKPIDQDSDSDEDWNLVPERPDSTNAEGVSERMARMKVDEDEGPPPPMPPRPGTVKGKEPEEPEEPEEDPDDPFGNQYEIQDGPTEESEGVKWYE